MTLHPVSLIAIAILVGALAVAWSRRFLAAGALALANIVLYILTALGPTVIVDGQAWPAIQADLALWSTNIATDPALAALQAFTSMFVHANFMHLFGNLIILLAFALPFEERIGHRRLVAIYVLSGLLATLTQVMVTADRDMVLLGASGAVFGIIGAFAASYPNLIVPLPLPLFVITFFVRMRVWVAAIIFGTMQLLLLSVFPTMPGQGNVAYFAHLGGLAAGILLGWTIVKGKVRAHRAPVAVDLEALSPFARDTGTAAALTQMRTNHDEPQIFQAWLDRFFRTATCPQCSHKVMPRHHGEIVCTQGHRFDVRRDRRRPIAAT